MSADFAGSIEAPTPVVDRGGPAQPLLIVHQLRKHFTVRGGQRLRAVHGVSFSVAKGETLGIVRESGCGKSTTARLIARLPRADGGEMVGRGAGSTPTHMNAPVACASAP